MVLDCRASVRNCGESAGLKGKCRKCRLDVCGRCGGAVPEPVSRRVRFFGLRWFRRDFDVVVFLVEAVADC